MGNSGWPPAILKPQHSHDLATTTCCVTRVRRFTTETQAHADLESLMTTYVTRILEMEFLTIKDAKEVRTH